MPYARRCVLALAALALFGGCREGTLEPRPPEIPSIAPASVTPEVAQALGPDGRFVAHRLSPASVNGFTAADAEDLAFRHLRWFGKGYEGYFSAFHGRTVRVERLRVCRPTHYAEPSITVSDTTNLPRLIREHIDGAFLVSLCQEGDPNVAVLYGVGPSAATYRFGNRIHVPTDGGRAIVPAAIPLGRDPFPAPERAVKEIWESTGVRVSRVPKLVLAHPRFSPEYARWEAPLEREVDGNVGRTRTRHSILSFGYILDGINPPLSVLGMVPDTVPDLLRELTFTDAENVTRHWTVVPRQGHTVWHAPFSLAGGRSQ
jgi:hypothetical protein